MEAEPPRAEGSAGDDRGDDRKLALWGEVGSRRAPVALALGLAGALLLRLPFLGLPLTADEGGYAEIARLWSNGHGLYSELFVDRPQGLLLVYRALLDLGADSTVALRAAAAGVGVATVLALAFFVTRVGGRIDGTVAAVLLGTAGASPFVESFTLSGELLGSFVAVLALCAFTGWFRRRSPWWVASAGLLCGAAVMVKQSALDAAIAIGVYLVLRREWKAVGILVVAAALPVVAGVLSAASVHDWWEAVVAYRGQGDSLATGSVGARFHQFWQTAPQAALALVPLALLAVVGFTRAPLLVRLWLVGAAVGVLGGGNFHAHYYVQLAAPLAALGAFGVARLGMPALAAVVAIAVLSTAFLALQSRDTQTRVVWRHDPHLRVDGDVVPLIQRSVPPGKPIAVVWGDASLYFLANRPPAVRSLWYRNAQAIRGAAARDIEAVRKGVPLVVALAPALRAYPELREVLHCEYRPVRVTGPLHVFRFVSPCA